jgi:O-acetyl-ADP-ribose deacetylase (regulator of RNase III)
MITYLRTSLFKSEAQTLVNPVNCVGVMGKGLAASFRDRFPGMFVRYKEICENGLLDVGKLWLWKDADQWVLNFPTKRHWRNPSELTFIELGLRKFVDTFEQRGITEVAFPRLGCGNGGLDWSQVGPLMERYLKPLPIPIYIHDFEAAIGEPEHIESLPTTGGRSFPIFWEDLRFLLSKREEFTTFGTGAKYVAFAADDSIEIQRGNGKAVTFTKDEMFEVWAALMRGVMTRSKLIGRAHDEAYYIFPILARLPYVRPLQAERAGSSAAIGLRMISRSSPSPLRLATGG